MGLISVLKKKNTKTLFTTPSHSGKLCIFHKFYQWYRYDISEVDAYEPEKALEDSERRAAQIYGTKYTKFLTNGSSSGIIASVLASKAKKILIWDKSHCCHKNACMLAGAEVIEYKLPFDEVLGVYKALNCEKLDELLISHKPDAIIVTSPTYEGFVADIPKISEICKKRNVILIVDEAHGALYPFSDKLPISAVNYADFTVQSLHKTAGGINPTALLHSNSINPDNALKMITTTSPSYPMLTTIEANINYINSKKGRQKLNQLIASIEKLNLPRLNDDITKILIKKENYTGYELSDVLFNKYGIEDERTNEKTTMLLCGLGTTKEKIERLRKALCKI